MKPKVYIESSVISVAANRMPSDLVLAAKQKMTLDWWTDRSSHLSLFISQLVLGEIGSGDAVAAERRLSMVRSLPLLEMTDDALELARSMLISRLVPKKAAEDAIHIAVAAVHGMDYLVSWNCKHIANAMLRIKIANGIERAGYRAPVICTPEELMGV